jgi:hypothetical protein
MRTAKNEEEIIPKEKWLVSFRKNGKPFVRQFWAEGYYEAYDTVLTHAEQRKLEVLWLKEKRNCGSRYLSKNFPELETICVYCRAIFNETEPVPCYEENCSATFCSRTCMEEHHRLRHKETNRATEL